MNDVSILDLFWLTLKFLAALGLVGLLVFFLYLLFLAIRHGIRISQDIVSGRITSVSATVFFVFALIALVASAALGVEYIHDHSSLFH